MIIIAVLATVCAAQSYLLWQLSDRSIQLAKVAGEAIGQSDQAVDLALAWKDIAEFWRRLSQQSSDRCTMQGRAI